MKLSFDNVGPFIGHNEIEIDGITILAGVNGSGKSTCGKILYCIFNCFQNIDEKISIERKRSINSFLRSYFLDSNTSRTKLRDINHFSEDIINNPDSFNYDDLNALFNYSITREQYEYVKEKIEDSLRIDDSTIRNRLLSDQIEYEFGKQFCNITSDNYASVELKIHNNIIAFNYGYSDACVSDYFSISKNIFYFDDPNLIDYLDSGFRYYSSYDKSHQNTLLMKLNNRRNENLSSVDHILLDNKLLELDRKIQSVCDGDIVVSDKGDYLYYSDVFKSGLNISNMATGLKSFALLKLLLKNGYLEEKGTVIFDEPEIHLHPEWQMAWAEIIVLLNKIFGIHVLLSSHSSDFLLFLEFFSIKYGLKDVTRLYSLDKDENGLSKINDASTNWDIVYKKLGMPFIRINGELNKDD